jgi:hypothetical protein
MKIRRVCVALVVALAAGPLVSPAPAGADPSVAGGGPTEAEQACIEAAFAAGESAVDAADACLDPAVWDAARAPQVSTSSLLAASCSLVPQKPYSLDRLVLWWGAIVICDQGIVASVFSGTAQTSTGVPVGASAGPGIIPLGGFHSWNNPTACPLPGYYRSAIATANAVTVDGGVHTWLLQTSGSQFVDCFL